MPTETTDTAREPTARARPIWFPVRGQPCAGWLYEVPERPARGAVVLCPSIGLEYEASHRAFRALAPRLAERGFVALRFDYLGCGDSGDDPAGETGPEAWGETIQEAVALLRTHGFGRISMVGVRLGAVLAAVAATAGPPPAALVYWYPSKSGKDFLRHQVGLRRMIVPAPDRPPGEVELAALVLTEHVARTVRELPPLTATAPPSPTLVLTEGRDPGGFSEFTAVSTVPNPDAAHLLLGVEQQNASPDPEDVDRIVEHLASTLPGADSGDTTGIPSATARELSTSWGTTVRESPVRICSDRLYAVLTEPAGDARHGASSPASGTPATRSYDNVVFLNAVDLSHIGPGREWVQQARRWAPLGVRSLRLDIGGIGDSAWPITSATPADYPTTATDDILGAIAFLSTAPSDRTLLVGLCSGAFRATAIAGMGGIAGVCLLNPTRFATPAGVRGELPSAATPPPAPATGLRRWRQLINLRTMRGHRLTRAVAPRVPDVVWHAVNVLAGTDPPVRQLRELVASDVAVHIISGPDDAVPMTRGAKRRLRKLATSDRFSFDVVQSLDHNFHAGTGRTEAMELAWRYVSADRHR